MNTYWNAVSGTVEFDVGGVRGSVDFGRPRLSPWLYVIGGIIIARFLL